MIGLRQTLFGGVLDLQLVQRDGRDEFSQVTTDTQPDGYRHRQLTNDGSSRHRAVTLGWFGEFGQTLVGFNLAYSETETSNADYDDGIDPTASGEYVSYRGRRVRRGELDTLREDFARPWVANLSFSRPFGDAFRADFNTRYRGATPISSEATGPRRRVDRTGERRGYQGGVGRVRAH